MWYFPDGYLPEKVGSGPMEAHEALMLLNTSSRTANVKLDFYFADRDPVKDVPVSVGASVFAHSGSTIPRTLEVLRFLAHNTQSVCARTSRL